MILVLVGFDEEERVARRTIKVIDVVEVMVHWHAGRRIGELSLVAWVWTRRRSASTRPQRSRRGSRRVSGPFSEAEWAALVAVWFPELVDRSGRQKTWPEIEPHRERIEALVG